MRRAGALILCLVITTSCGDALSGVGDLSHRIVFGDQEPTTTTVPLAPSQSLGLKGITDLAWSNDGIDDSSFGLDREATITAVWRRGDSATPFVQASRHEIATALPGIEFPQLAPATVTHVSSQMLFDQLTGTLDASTAAAFGLWVGAPYDLPRQEGQLAVLRVGLKTFDDADEGDVFSFQVSDGRELAWTDGAYVYQLFCRRGVSEAACFEMAESTIPLSLILSLP